MEKDQQTSLDYQRPGAHRKEVGDIGGSKQRTFDRVAGPNLRLRDNLIQAGSCAAGFVMGGELE